MNFQIQLKHEQTSDAEWNQANTTFNHLNMAVAARQILNIIRRTILEWTDQIYI